MMNLVLPRVAEPLTERLMRHSMPVTECGCWIWVSSSLREDGHGQLNYRGKPDSAHRLSWKAFRGTIPKGLHVLHRCNVASCVNPDHLYLGTDLENARDRIIAGTQFPPPKFKGIGHPNARLSEDVVRSIRAATGTGREIAARFGIPRATVHAIRSGRQWSSVQ